MWEAANQSAGQRKIVKPRAPLKASQAHIPVVPLTLTPSIATICLRNILRRPRQPQSGHVRKFGKKKLPIPKSSESPRKRETGTEVARTKDFYCHLQDAILRLPNASRGPLFVYYAAPRGRSGGRRARHGGGPHSAKEENGPALADAAANKKSNAKVHTSTKDDAHSYINRGSRVVILVSTRYGGGPHSAEEEKMPGPS